MAHFWNALLFGQSVHLNTLLMVWAAMALILGVAFLTTRKLDLVPEKGQTFAESVYDFCRSITFSTAGKRGDVFLFYIGSLFLFIATSNVIGQLPLKLIRIPQGELIAATGDINVPAALAVCTLLAYFVFGLHAKGPKYFSHYLTPLPALMKGQPPILKVVFGTLFSPFMLLNVLEDVTRPGSLMFRLFFNIFIGEILALIMQKLVPGGIGLGALVIGLELFVALLQAYIFAMLSSVYISLMSEDHDDHHDEEHGSDSHDTVRKLPKAA
jgi:F-type H+-transporting ATPase subunit a